MVMDDALRILRDYLIEVDPATSVYTDDALVQALTDALRVLLAKNVRALTGLTIDLTGAFVPDATDPQGLIVVLKAAVTILSNEYRGRLKRGEFGISWQSGLEQESSVTAAKEYSGMIDDLASELDQIVLINDVNFSALRAQ